jgi:hypothetical protein
MYSRAHTALSADQQSCDAHTALAFSQHLHVQQLHTQHLHVQQLSQAPDLPTSILFTLVIAGRAFSQTSQKMGPKLGLCKATVQYQQLPTRIKRLSRQVNCCSWISGTVTHGWDSTRTYFCIIQRAVCCRCPSLHIVTHHPQPAIPLMAEKNQLIFCSPVDPKIGLAEYRHTWMQTCYWTNRISLPKTLIDWTCCLNDRGLAFLDGSKAGAGVLCPLPRFCFPCSTASSLASSFLLPCLPEAADACPDDEADVRVSLSLAPGVFPIFSASRAFKFGATLFVSKIWKMFLFTNYVIYVGNWYSTILL